MKVLTVSICCQTYNHYEYLEQCLDSLLMQKSDFKYEILLRDDASTDGTTLIVKEYASKYLDIIKPLIYSENQFSNGVSPFHDNVKRAQGKYIAICEGDDYWTDPYKLQMQVEHMESNPETSLCVHASTVVKSSTGKVVKTIRPSDVSRYFDTDEIIQGGGGLFATNSMLFKRSSYLQRPSYFSKSRVGDYPLMIHLSTLGKVYYLDRYLSVYRTAIRGSWTSTTYSGTIQKMLDHNHNIVQLLHEIDHFYERRYARAIQRKIREIEFATLQMSGAVNKIRNHEYADLYASLSLQKKIILFITRTYYPKISSVLKRTVNFYNRVIESFFIKLNSLNGSIRK
jgi:glycosyltransferase involved in cell wall biosynthesis